MTSKSKYYARIAFSNLVEFEEYLARQNIVWTLLSRDICHSNNDNGTLLYSIHMDSEAALALKLSFPLKGFLNFSKSFDKFVDSVEH